jgi:hypothetical protein
MKSPPEEKLFTNRGLLIIAFVFSIYAICLLSVDPEWVLWAGSMSLGSLYIPDQPPRLIDSPRETIQLASVLCLLGLIALLCLMAIMGEVTFGWLSWLKARWTEWRSQEALGERELPRISVAAHPQGIDDGPTK